MPPFSRDIAEEGALFDGIAHRTGRHFDEAAVRAVLAAGTWPARNPEQNVADLKAQVAACARGSRIAARLRATWRGDRHRLYGPRAGQCRRIGARSHRRAGGRRIRHADGRRHRNPRGDDGGPRRAIRARRLHRHQSATGHEQSERAGIGHQGRGAVCVPLPGRQRHPDERGLPEAHRDRGARGIAAEPAARPRPSPAAMWKPARLWSMRCSARWASWRRRRAR